MSNDTYDNLLSYDGGEEFFQAVLGGMAKISDSEDRMSDFSETENSSSDSNSSSESESDEECPCTSEEKISEELSDDESPLFHKISGGGAPAENLDNNSDGEISPFMTIAENDSEEEISPLFAANFSQTENNRDDILEDVMADTAADVDLGVITEIIGGMLQTI